MSKSNAKSESLTTVYIKLSGKPVASSKEVVKGHIYVDLDDKGKPVGFEFLNPVSVKINGEEHDAI